MYIPTVYSFYFKFFSRKWVKIAEVPALATDKMKNPSAPKVLKMFHEGPFPNYGACRKWHILFMDIFQRNLAHLLMGMKKESELFVLCALQAAILNFTCGVITSLCSSVFMLIDGHHVKVPATSFCKIFLLIQPQT
jgi:hypothetical protein